MSKLSIALVLTTVGCSVAPPLHGPPPTHPASPAAAAAPLPERSNVLGLADRSEAGEPDHPPQMEEDAHLHHREGEGR